MPIYYDDPIKEYWALVNDVTLWDVSVERIVEITGPDASEFTNYLTCRTIIFQTFSRLIYDALFVFWKIQNTTAVNLFLILFVKMQI